MEITLYDICSDAGRAAGQLTRRDVARGLLSVPAADAIAELPALRRELLAAGNPLSGPFWDSAEALLSAIREGTATVGDVRRWLEATGSEPTEVVTGGFVWPEEAERGPVATEMHARLVARLETLVSAGAIDPDRLLAGDKAALEAYDQAQVEWLYAPLPDGREPIWAVTDEDDEAFLQAWDDADADARQILVELLADVGPRPCPQAALSAACDRLRDGLRRLDWPYDVLRAAGGVDPAALPDDDHELWLTLAAGVIVCKEEPPHDDGSYTSWIMLDHPSWIGAVVPLIHAGPGADADADALAHHAATFDFEEVDADESALDEDDDGWPDVTEDWASDHDDERHLSVGFHTVALLWRLLGAIDEDWRLTALGWWGLPESLLRAWQHRDEQE